MAARRKELDISVGNLIGSNIFNLFGVVGITSIFTDIPVNQRTLDFDWFWMIGICLVLFVFMLPTKNAKITWWKGLILLLSYFTYYYIIYK
jgi:cation:H+ antiporter